MKLSLSGFRLRRARGYSLVELTLAMGVGMMVALMLMAIFNQQLAFLKIFSAQSFLTTEAPIINNYMSRVLGSAEGYQLYSSVSAFTSSATPVLADAPVLVLKFKEPSGIFRYSVMSFEDPGSGMGRGLYFRHVTSAGVLGTPEWALTKQPTDVKFSITEGILRARITGPNGEEITYSGTQQL
jgi:hypothetical protein